MEVSARPATLIDVARIVELYRPALDEQVALREAWSVAEGLAEPLDDTLRLLLSDDDSLLAVGLIDDVVFGFSWAQIAALLPQAGEEQLGVIRLVYVAEPAREVGVGESMLDLALTWLRERGISRFDAIVSPGHRLAKNFFESAGFSARRITMYRRDQDDG
ncbi:MAG: GNAT family N-acetyltransferase [Acidimicrobiia bacterium]|nr:GNAT family N-acetyltransferase [Acidimicrobiia bacterium]